MYSVVEGNNLTFEVVVESPVTLVRDVEVTVTLINGTAKGMFILEIGTLKILSVLIYSYPAPGDYMLGPIVLTLTGSNVTAMVNIVNDKVAEVDEMFDMMLSSNDLSVLIVEDTATVTINDSGELSPCIVQSFSDICGVEGKTQIQNFFSGI